MWLLIVIFVFWKLSFAQVNDYALDFDGIDDYIEVPATSFVTNQLTVSAWIKPDGKAYDQTIVDHRSENGGWHLSINGDYYPVGIWLTLRNSLGEEKYFVSYVIVANEWQHIAVTFNGETIRLYRNGNLKQVFKINDSVVIEPNSITRIGYNVFNYGTPFDGQMDEVRIWNIVRSQTQIKGDMISELTGNEIGLHGYWRFNEGSGTSIGDASGNENTGTFISYPTWLVSSTPITGQGVIADFIADITSGLPPFSVTYSNQSIGIIGSYAWDFGDKQTSTSVEPTNTYEFANPFQVKLTVTSALDPTVKSTEIKNHYIIGYPDPYPYPVPKTFQAPVIDGVLDPIWQISKQYTDFNDIWKTSYGTIDAQPRFRMMWDEKYLYFFLSIRDDILIHDSGHDHWQDDAIELYFDGNNSKEVYLDGIDDISFFLNYTPDLTNKTEVLDNAPLEPYIQLCGMQTGEGWNMEVAVSWEDLIKISPAEGHIFGLEVQYDDDDDGGIRDNKFIWWATTDETWISPDIWTTAILVDYTISSPEISDVPDDQGGWVYVNWEDNANEGLSEITLYRIWEQNPEGEWVSLGTVPAVQQNTYMFLAHTFGDSTTEDGIFWSKFYVTAHTTDPNVYYISEVDSGYSVDNLAPSVPMGLLAQVTDENTIKLSWDTSGDNDFNYFKIYRSIEEDFDPSGIESYTATTDTLYIDTDIQSGEIYYYRITAIDFHGNESGASELVSASVVLLSSDTKVRSYPREFNLQQNYPNPFNPSTIIPFELPDISHVTITVYTVLGQKLEVLTDKDYAAGYHTITFYSKDYASGIYIVQAVMKSQNDPYCKKVFRQKIMLMR